MNYGIVLSCVLISIVSFQSSKTTVVAQYTVEQSNIFYQGIQKFSANFYKTLAKNTNGNLISSPISALMVAAMTAYGANGKTKEELTTALNLPMNERFIVYVIHDFIKNLNNAKNVELHLANGLFIQDDFKIKELFIRISNLLFESSIDNINFQNINNSAEIINNWCKNKTNNKITNIVKPADLVQAKLVMINAVYFKGNWVNPFKKMLGERNFYLSNTNAISIKMMCNIAQYNYHLILNDIAWSIELPYEANNPSNQYSMYIILPREIEGLDKIINQLDKINFLDENDSKKPLQLCMPEFKFNSELNLKPIFQQMGINDVFEDTADLSGITSRNNIKISKIIQKAFINVDEKGSEASAATGAIVMGRMITSSINVDKPFISVIVSKSSGTPLFWARINDPRY